MTNAEIAAVLLETSELLRIKGGDGFRARAFAQTARVLTSLTRPALDYGPSLLKQKGIGPGSVERIRAISRTGTCDDHRRLLGEMPRGLRELLTLKGLGPATVRRLYRELGVGCVEHLELALVSGQLERAPAFGPRLAARLAREVDRHRRREVRLPLREAIAIGEALVVELAGHPDALRVELAGSARRRRASLRDLDILVAAANAGAVAEVFKRLSCVEEVIVDGERRASVRLHGGLQADLRLVDIECFGAGLHYFTGSKMHNIAIRVRANRKHLAVTEHGVFHRTTRKRPKNKRHHEVFPRMLPGSREADIFGAVGLPLIPPELREDAGEIEAAEAGRLPTLVDDGDVTGSLWEPDSQEGLGRMRARGWSYVALTPRAERFSNAAAARAHLAEARARPGVLAGFSVHTRRGGTLPVSRKLLSEADWVIARISEEANVDDAVAVIESGVVDAVRLPVLDDVLDEARLARACVANSVALVIDGAGRQPRTWRQARELGTPLVLARGADDEDMRFAVYEARRGWLARGDVLNCGSREGLDAHRARRGRTVHAPPAADDELLQRLAAPLDAALRERLRLFMERGEDAALAMALARMAAPGQSALQHAFVLWQRSP